MFAPEKTPFNELQLVACQTRYAVLASISRGSFIHASPPFYTNSVDTLTVIHPYSTSHCFSTPAKILRAERPRKRRSQNVLLAMLAMQQSQEKGIPV